MTAEEILVKAAELVERPGGWTQGKYVAGTAVCLHGAIFHADGAPLDAKAMCLHSLSHNAFDALRAVGREVDKVHAVQWNDEPWRTAEEVATALRNAKRWL